ncbi:DinB family protein [Saccharibacillus kuerlensis]|uniref:Damage-inducible protein DinB n=1 Tax=Saccharibacillus kuerlensis TaxID=459527 RepID=A0ABQ2L4P5_9BACL|nr:DinB family protein [Saccharibacillus kuerlensis]GGO02906.1 hypothetical protein GCM10010969_26660 [Saccharibacillus kuerlensis]
MHPCCKSIFDQLDIAIESVQALIRSLNEEELVVKGHPNKMSVGELLAHLSVLCEADFRIGAGASLEDMQRFYEQTEPAQTLQALESSLLQHYSALKTGIASLTNRELEQQTVSYWGVKYSRFEWLVETLAHFYHHRGQLHAMIVHVLHKNPEIKLFE